MVRTCPERGDDRTDLDPAVEMGSAVERYECGECALRFASDAYGLLTEVDA